MKERLAIDAAVAAPRDVVTSRRVGGGLELGALAAAEAAAAVGVEPEGAGRELGARRRGG